VSRKNADAITPRAYRLGPYDSCAAGELTAGTSD